MRIAAFDWDGTLVHFNGLRPDYEDSAWLLRHTKPYHVGLKRARTLREHGAKLHVVTGRGEHARAVTLAQIRQNLDPEFPAKNLHNHPHGPHQFPGMAALRIFKAGVLNQLQPDLYVGDNPEADAMAANDAGIPFMDAAQFRAGYPFPFGAPWVHRPPLGAALA